MSRQHPSQQDHGPFYASDATLSFTTNREEPVNVELPTGSTQLNNILASSRVVVQGWPVKFSIRE